MLESSLYIQVGEETVMWAVVCENSVTATITLMEIIDPMLTEIETMVIFEMELR